MELLAMVSHIPNLLDIVKVGGAFPGASWTWDPRQNFLCKGLEDIRSRDVEE